MVDHPDIRRILQILSQRQCMKNKPETKSEAEQSVPQDESNDSLPEFSSIIKRNLSNIEMRDICFKIMRMCSSFSFADVIASPKDFEKILETATPTINDLLTNSCFVESKSCKRITTINWPQGIQSITDRSATSIVTEKEL